MPAGRPSDYKPEYCARVKEWGRLGKSKAWMCSQLECTPQTLINWANAHPEFLEALELASIHSQATWEDLGQSGMVTPGFNASIWSRSMAARFPSDWRESKAIEHSGAIDTSSKEQRDAATAAFARADT